MTTESKQYETVAVFDRMLGKLDGVPHVDKTKAATVIALVDIVGQASTFIVQTYRNRPEDGGYKDMDPAGDYIFIQHIDAAGSQRFILPPSVADVIARQRDALTTKARTRGAKAAAAARKANGAAFGFAAMSPAERKAARAKAKATRQRKAAARAARKARR